MPISLLFTISVGDMYHTSYTIISYKLTQLLYKRHGAMNIIVDFNDFSPVLLVLLIWEIKVKFLKVWMNYVSQLSRLTQQRKTARVICLHRSQYFHKYFCFVSYAHIRHEGKIDVDFYTVVQNFQPKWLKFNGRRMAITSIWPSNG